MALVDLDGTWRDLNQALCRLLGAGRDELLATDLEALTHRDEQRAGLTLARCLTSTGLSFTLTTRYRHADGRYLPIEQSVGVIGGAGSEPAHAIVYFQSARPGPPAEALVPK
jgi:PAS domain S-box-containing protein